MRKLFSFMLLAAGLLISTQGWANQPERPTPPMEPNAPEGVEMLKPEAPQIAPASVAQMAPRKAAATPVAQIGEQTFTTLKAALEAVEEGQTITLVAGVEEEKRLEINKANVTLDLNQNRIHYTGGDNVTYDDSPWAIASSANGVKIINGDIYYDYPYYYHLEGSPWYSYNTRAISVNGGSLTLEKVVAYGAYGYGGTYAVWIEGGATVTIEDGCFIYGNTASTGEDVYVNPKSTGTYILHGGTYTKNRYAVPEGYMWFNNGDGTYTVMEKKVAKIGTTTYKTIAEAINAAKANDEIVLLDNIDGGVVVDGTNLTINTDAYAINGELSVSNATVKVKGGNITSFNEGTDGDIDIYSGTYTIAKTTLDSYVAAGYTARDNGDETCTVGKFVAQIGSDFYFGLQDAFDHVPESGVEPTTITITAPITEELNITLSDKRNVKLDLAGYTIMFTNRNMITIEAGSKLVFANTQSGSIYSTGGDAIFDCYGTLELGNMSITSKGDAIFWNEKGGNVTIYDGTYTSEGSTYGIMYNEGTLHIVDGTFKGGDSAYGLYVAGGIVTIDDIDLYAGWYALYVKGGTITMTDGDVFSDFYGIYSNSKSTITVDGGTITGDEYYAFYLNSKENLYINGGEFISKQVILSSYGANTYVTGGKFKKPSGAIFSKVSGQIKVSGGFFNTTDIGDCEIQTGYALVKTTVEGEEDDWYEVGKIKAQVGELGYLHIEDAVAAAVAAGEQYVIVVADLEDVEVNQSITLCLGKHTINNLTATNGATVIVEGRPDASIGSVDGDVLLKGGTYTFDPRTNSNIAEDYDVKTIEGEPTKYQVGVYAAKLSTDGKTYMTLKEAITAAGTADSAIITMVKDLMVYESKTTINKGQNITIDLNGHLISTDDRNALDVFVQGSSLLNNSGILTIADGSEAGNGKITYYCAQPDLSGWASDVTINNSNKMYVKGGTIENRGIGASSYAIDVTGGLYITKGVVVVPNNENTAIRIIGAKTHREIIIDGGKNNEVTVDRIWLQDPSAVANSMDVTIDIKHAVVKAIRLGYSGTGAHEKLIINLDHVTITEGFFRLDFVPDELNYKADSCTIQSYYLVHPFQHLTSGIFQFKNDIQLYYVNYTQALKTQYPEEEGWKIVRDSNDPSRAGVYISAEKLLHEFHQNILPNYGLVCIDEENKWYEIRPLQGTTGEESEIYGELGNPWHEDKTWDLSETDVVPQDTTPVLIDHNVYVEENTQAVAASLQIEAGQTLTVKSGATLQIQDAGALFKDETAQLIVEPDAVVTVGSNGVIADNENNIIIKASETEQGVFMCHPDVQLNTKPEATVYLYTKAKQIAGAPNYEYIYQRFAIPTSDGEATIYGDDYTNQKLCTGETSYVDAVFGWDNKKLDWQMLARWKDMKPFVGYQVTNNTMDGGITYSFKGNLVGNHDGNFTFVDHPEQFQFFGNSYTAPIYIPTFLDSIAKHYPVAENTKGDIEWSVWVFDEEADQFVAVDNDAIEFGLARYKNGSPITEIRSMQAFILKGKAGCSTDVSYSDAIWGNPRFNGRLDDTEKAPRRAKVLDMNVATIRIEAENGQADQVSLIESNEFTQDFDNGADASKYVYTQGINLYANTTNGKLAHLASDNVEGTILGFKAGVSENYTIRFSNLNGDEFTLIDLENQQRVEMTADATYSFRQKAKSANEARFMIVRNAPSVTTDMNELNNANSTIKVVENGQFMVIQNGVRYNALGEKL